MAAHMPSANPLQRPPTTLTMTDQEGRRLDSLSWKREALDADLRQQGGRGDGAGSSGQGSWGSFGGRGGMTRATDNRPPSGGNSGVRGGCTPLQDVNGGFASLRMGPSQKSTGWSTSPPNTMSQQQRMGHSAAPTFSRTSSGNMTPSNSAASGPVSGETRGAVGPSSHNPEAGSTRTGQSSSGPSDSFMSFRRENSGPKDRSSTEASHTPTGVGGGIDLGGGLTWKPRRTLTREEEITRNVKSLLNKLTIEKFNIISEKIARVLEGSLNKNSEVQLIVDAMIDKAVSEPDWSEMYADLCQVLQWRSVAPEGDPETIRRTPFMMALLNRIQGEFEAMPTVLNQELTGEGEERQLEEARVKRRVLGVVKLIGELFHRRLLGFKVVNDVVVELVIKSDEPDEHHVECFLELIATVGYFIDQNPKMKVVLDSWFGRLRELQNKSCYSKRLKCVIQDTIDMRRAEWRKKIHKERAKALNDLRSQLETEEVLGGSVHAAQYGNIVVVGERTNLNGQYLGYLKEQEQLYDQRVARRIAAAGGMPRRSAPTS